MIQPSAFQPSLAAPVIAAELLVCSAAQAAEPARFADLLAQAPIIANDVAAPVIPELAGLLPAETASAALPQDGKNLPEEAALPQPAQAAPLPLNVPLPAPALPQVPPPPAEDQESPAPHHGGRQMAATPPAPVTAGAARPAGAAPASGATPGPAQPVLLQPEQSLPIQPPPRPSGHRVLPLEPPPPAILGSLQAPGRKGAGLSAAVSAAFAGADTFSASQAASQPAAELAGPLAPVAPGPGNANPAALQPTVANPAPHDFALLIDRLVAAREGALPHSATLALAHAEFGQVELRFASDADGLSVAFSSADPDFTRAVQAAAALVPPPSSSASADTGPRGSGSHGGSQSGGHFEHGSSQPHGQAAGNQSSRRDSPARPAGHSRAEPRGDRGIFA